LNSELIDRHARQRHGEDLFEVFHGQAGDRLAIARHHGFEGLDVRKLRPLLDHGGHAVETIDHLAVHRLLDPQRAVLVERRDALGFGHEAGAPRGGGVCHERDDDSFGGAIVP
jgi:hypothetical protein